MINFEEYQKEAKTTAIYPKLNPSWIYPALGLAGESGEVLEKLKKILRDNNSETNEEQKQLLKKELGDIIWYISTLATELELSLQDIAEHNLEKLKSRKERGVLHGNGDKR